MLQLTSPVVLKRASWNSLSPSLIFSSDMGLSAGMGTSGRPSGAAVAIAETLAITKAERRCFMAAPCGVGAYLYRTRDITKIRL